MKIGLIGVSVRAAAEAISDRIPAARAIDFFADHDTQLAVPNSCFPISNWSQVDSLLSSINDESDARLLRGSIVANADPSQVDWEQKTGWIVTGGLEFSPKILESISTGGHKVLGCQVASIQFSKTPERWCSVLQESGVSVPKFSRSSVCPPGQWFRKEAWGHDRWFWQAAVPGELASAIYLATSQGTELVGCTRLFCRSDYGYLGNLATREWPESVLLEPIQRIGKILAQTGQFQGLFGVDLILDRTRRIWPIEINPRPTASVEVLAGLLHRNLFIEHLTACGWTPGEGDPKTRENEGLAPQIACKHTIYNRYQPLTISDQRFRQLVDRKSFHLIDVEQSGILNVLGSSFDRPQRYWRQRFADIPPVGTTIPPGQPICSLLAQAAGFRGEAKVDSNRLLTWLHPLEDRIFSFGTKPELRTIPPTQSPPA